MWIYNNKIYETLSEIRKKNNLNTTNIKWLRKNNYIYQATEEDIITYKVREPYNSNEREKITI